MQVIHRSLSRIPDMPAAGFSREQHREIVVLMPVAVAEAAAIDDERMIKQRAVAVR